MAPIFLRRFLTNKSAAIVRPAGSGLQIAPREFSLQVQFNLQSMARVVKVGQSSTTIRCKNIRASRENSRAMPQCYGDIPQLEHDRVIYGHRDEPPC